MEMHDVTGEVKTPRSANDKTLVKRSIDRRMHYGAELGFVELATGDFLLALRGGRSQGYSSKGAEINLFHVLRLSYTAWTDDIGYAEKSLPRKQQAAYLSFRIWFLTIPSSSVCKPAFCFTNSSVMLLVKRVKFAYQTLPRKWVTSEVVHSLLHSSPFKQGQGDLFPCRK